MIDSTVGPLGEMEEEYVVMSLSTCEAGHEPVHTPKHLECFGIHVYKYSFDDAFEEAKLVWSVETTVS